MVDRNEHNRRSRFPGQVSQMREVLIIALRRGRPEHTGETEGVLFVVDGDQVREILDDGEELIFDASELRMALVDG